MAEHITNNQPSSVEDSRGLQLSVGQSPALPKEEISPLVEYHHLHNRLDGENDIPNRYHQRRRGEYSRPFHEEPMVPDSNMSAPLSQQDLTAFQKNPQRTLFVRDLPYHFRDEDLRQWMVNMVDGNDYGVELCRVKYSLKLNKTLQVGFVMLRTEELAQRVFDSIRAAPRCAGRDLRVEMFEAAADCEKSFAGSVQFQFDAEFTEPLVTEEMVRGHFESTFGEILTICIRAHYHKGVKQSGFGFVSFVDSRSDDELKQGAMLQRPKIIYRFHTATQKQAGGEGADSFLNKANGGTGHNSSRYDTVDRRKYRNSNAGNCGYGGFGGGYARAYHPHSNHSRRNHSVREMGMEDRRARSFVEYGHGSMHTEHQSRGGRLSNDDRSPYPGPMTRRCEEDGDPTDASYQQQRPPRYYAEGEFPSEVTIRPCSPYGDPAAHHASTLADNELDSIVSQHEGGDRPQEADVAMTAMGEVMGSVRPGYRLMLVPLMEGSYPTEADSFLRHLVSPMSGMTYMGNGNTMAMSRMETQYGGGAGRSNMNMMVPPTMGPMAMMVPNPTSNMPHGFPPAMSQIDFQQQQQQQLYQQQMMHSQQLFRQQQQQQQQQVFHQSGMNMMQGMASSMSHMNMHRLPPAGPHMMNQAAFYVENGNDGSMHSHSPPPMIYPPQSN